MYSNRRPYYGLKLSIADFFREPVRYLKQSNTQESMMEKPYLEEEYPKMHLRLPDFKYKSRRRLGLFVPIADEALPGGIAIIEYGEARCRWITTNAPTCIGGPVLITLSADYLFTTEFNFTAEIVENTANATMTDLSGTAAGPRDEQVYMLDFPKNANGKIIVCGYASTHTLISQTFETVVAGQPVGMYKIGSAFMPIERGQSKPATLLKSSYGEKGAKCGCITFETNCIPCDSTDPTTWDYDTSADTVNREDSVGIAVQDGIGPYTWSVSGTGFSLTNAQTSGVSNMLNADASACGTATITVMDKCGVLVTGYVRGTEGEWILKGNFCGLGGGAFVQMSPGWTKYEIINGNKKQTTYIGIGGGTVGYYGCNDPATTCAGPVSGCAEWNCDDIYNSIGYCGDYCCYSTEVPEPCGGVGAKRFGNCIETKSLNYYEWECAP